MNVRYFRQTDAASLFAMMREEGDEWSDYSGDPEAFVAVLEQCLTWVALESDEVIGFVRCREDGPYGVFVYDLLVRPGHRGNGIGKALLDTVVDEAGGRPVYVLSDEDAYYEKLGYLREGTIFRLNPS